jgi:hypothetical protein
MKRILLIIVWFPLIIIGQTKKEDSNFGLTPSVIADSLAKDAHTILRLDEGIVDVTAPGKYTFTVHQILTILNSDGDHNLRQVHGIDKFRKIDNIEIKVFNKSGALVKKYKKKDFAITAAFDGFSLVTDDQVMRLEIPAPGYPCTLEINYTEEVTSYINLPPWYFQNPGEAVMVSRFLVKIPAEIDIHYKAKNINITPVITTVNTKKNYLWEINNLIAKKPEPGAGEFAKIPKLLVAANQFEYDGHRGDMTGWKGMGLWYNDLVKNTNQLSDAYKSDIQNLVSGINSDIEKMRIIYNHLQKNFRYVSIQLGIGGFKPFTADFVHEKKYGDCKALSNYMQACLNALNIKSYSAWINAGSERMPVDPDFPYDGFNHQILCVPMDKDTVWLECTSSTSDFAHLGNFTENRNALILTENGGVLVPTPKSKSYENKFLVTTTIKLNENGSGNTEGIITTMGEYKYEQLALSQEKTDLQKQYFINYLGFPNPDGFELSFGEKGIKPFKTNIKLDVEKINDFIAGSKMFLRPRIYKIWSSKLPSAENRTENFLFAYPFEKTDTTVYVLPAGYKVDALPPTKELKTEFTSFTTKSWFDEAQRSVYTTVHIILKQHVIPAAKYAEVKKFFDDILINEGQKIVIKKE